MKTEGEENPFAFEVFQSTLPFAASSATVQLIVVTKTFPEATAGVDSISRLPVFRSHDTRIRSGAAEPATPEFDKSPRNSRAGCGWSGVGTGVRKAKDVDSNAPLNTAMTSPSRKTIFEIPTFASCHAWEVVFHPNTPT